MSIAIEVFSDKILRVQSEDLMKYTFLHFLYLPITELQGHGSGSDYIGTIKGVLDYTETNVNYDWSFGSKIYSF